MSQWGHICGSFTAQKRIFWDETKDALYNFLKKNEVEVDSEIKLTQPPLQTIFSMLRFDITEHRRGGSLADFDYPLFYCEGKGCLTVPTMCYTPCGSECPPTVDIYYNQPKESLIITPMPMGGRLSFTVVIRGGFRDFTSEDMPYVRLWWNLLNLWVDICNCSLTVYHAPAEDYDKEVAETLSDIDYNINEPKDVDKLNKLLTTFWDASNSWLEHYRAKLKGDPKYEPDFQTYYNYVWVKEHGDPFA